MVLLSLTRLELRSDTAVTQNMTVLVLPRCQRMPVDIFKHHVCVDAYFRSL